jgi:predicted amidophosphoribosyltransferase
MEEEALFCYPCQRLLSPLREEGYCKTCFQQESPCLFCKNKKTPYKKIGAVYDFFGPAQKIIMGLESGKAPYLAKGVAGALLSKFLEEEWKLPECITYYPTLPSKRFLRGYEHNKLVALEMGKALQIPVTPLLEVSEKKGGSLQFKCSKEAFYPNQTLLLIGDVIDKTRLFEAGEALLETYAKEVYCLCFATH